MAAPLKRLTTDDVAQVNLVFARIEGRVRAVVPAVVITKDFAVLTDGVHWLDFLHKNNGRRNTLLVALEYIPGRPVGGKVFGVTRVETTDDPLAALANSATLPQADAYYSTAEEAAEAVVKILRSTEVTR